MRHMFRITDPFSGFSGIFEAADPDQALDAMARAMGYHDYQHAARKGRIDSFYLLIERVTCEDILSRLNDADLEDLRTWKRFEDLDSVYLGGRGRAAWQIEAATRAWALLSLDAQKAFLAMRRAVVHDLVDAMRNVGIPKTDRDIDAVEALLGPGHPAFRIMPAHALMTAYMEALDQIDA